MAIITSMMAIMIVVTGVVVRGGTGSNSNVCGSIVVEIAETIGLLIVVVVEV